MQAKVAAPNTVQMFREKDGGYGLLMEVTDIRQEHTGLHGSVKLSAIVPHRKEPIFLAGTEGNIKRDEVRAKVINTALKIVEDIGGTGNSERIGLTKDSKPLVKYDLDLFCMEKVEAVLLAVGAPAMVKGDSTKPIEFRAKPHVLKDAGTILFGDHGQGKSMVAMAMAICIDAGLNGMWGVEEAPAGYINLERGEDSIQRRIGQVNDALGLETNRPLAVLNARGRNLLVVRPQIEQMVRERGVKFLILDSITRANVGDPNDAGPANQAMDILGSLVSSFVAIGHVGHSDKSRIIGSNMFAAAADIMLQHTSEKSVLPDGSSELGVMLKVTKANDIEWPKPMTLTLAFGANNIGLQHIKAAQTSAWPGLEARSEKERSLRARLVKLLTSQGEMVVQEMAVMLDISENVIRARLSEGRGKDFLLRNPGDRIQRWGALAKEQL